jgi:hypothetical protein
MTHIVGHEKPPLQDLVHFGVRGMHWGVRKARPTGSGRQAGGRADRIIFGKHGAAAIKQRVAKGADAKEVRKTMRGRAIARGILAVYGAAVMRNLVRVGVPLVKQAVTNAVLAKNTAKFANRGREAIPAIMRTAAKLKYAPLKGGAFVITDL